MKELIHTASIFVCATAAALSSHGAWAGPAECDCPDIALKTNLLHDALLTPDLGIEVALPANFSASLTGTYAWWSNDSRHRYWRIRMGVAEVRYWFGACAQCRIMTGHHAGIYVSLYDYDFEFGGRGWQSPDATFGAGISYGYSMKISRNLNLDFGVRAGYSGGTLIKYKPQCGNYVCTSHSFHRYFGLTGLSVSLVWFPGGHTKK